MAARHFSLVQLQHQDAKFCSAAKGQLKGKQNQSIKSKNAGMRLANDDRSTFPSVYFRGKNLCVVDD